MVSRASEVIVNTNGSQGIWIVSDAREQAAIRAALVVYRHWREANGRGMQGNAILDQAEREQSTGHGTLKRITFEELERLLASMGE